MDNVRRMAIVRCSPFIIAKALKMPYDHTIIGADWDFMSKQIKLYVEGPDLPVAVPWQMLREITPIITVAEDALTGEKSYTWDWNLGEKQGG